jgi:hypothetical protein
MITMRPSCLLLRRLRNEWSYHWFSVAGHVGDGLVRFQRIVNDDDIGTATGQHATNRGRHAESAFIGRKVVEGGLAQARIEESAVEW